MVADHFILFRLNSGNMTPVAKINETDRRIACTVLLSLSYKPHHDGTNTFLDNDDNVFVLIPANPDDYSVDIRKEIKELYDEYVDVSVPYCWFVKSGVHQYYYFRSPEQYCAYHANGYVIFALARAQVENIREIFETRYHEFLQKNKFEKVNFDHLPVLMLHGSRTKLAARS